jgi:hypothetical protein
MYKILSYELEPDGKMFKCKICFINVTHPEYESKPRYDVIPDVVNEIFLSPEELNLKLWKQSMLEQGKLTEEDVHLLDMYIDSAIEFYLKLDKEENEKHAKLH